MNTHIETNYIDDYIEEELTIAEFAERFLNISTLEPGKNPSISEEISMDDMDIEIFGRDLNSAQDGYFKINKFIIKPTVNEYYTDGQLNGTGEHRVIVNGEDIHLKDHPNFKKVDGKMKVVDFEIEKSHNYYANGWLNHNTVPGGKAMGYHCSVRVRLANAGKLKRGDTDVIGNKCKATVVKNRMGPPQRQALFDIYFDSGIADYGSWLEVLKLHSVITGGPNYTYVTNAGESVKFTSKEFVALLSGNEVLKEEMYLKICDVVIMKYKDPNSKIVEDATVDADGAGVETMGDE